MAEFNFNVNAPAGGTSSGAANESSISKENSRLFGTDIRFENDFFVNVRGDYQLLEGFENLRQAVYRRLITRPGEYKFVPEYGVGIQLYLKRPRTSTIKDELKNAIKENILRDIRIQEVIKIVVEDITDGVSIGIALRVAGKALLFTPFTFTKEI